MDPLAAPCFPIIHVRGYAMTPNEIAATVAMPCMGFNLGATNARPLPRPIPTWHLGSTGLSPIYRIRFNAIGTIVYPQALSMGDRAHAGRNRLGHHAFIGGAVE